MSKVVEADQRTVDIVMGYLKCLTTEKCTKISQLCIAYYFTPLFKARTIKDTNNGLSDDDSSDIEIELMDYDCLLIRNALNMKEQVTLFADIQRRDKSPKTMMKAMYPSPKTYVFGTETPTVIFKSDDDTVYNRLVVEKANSIMTRNNVPLDRNLSEYSSITMGAIKYPSPNGHFNAHIDHSNTFVYLTSIGCTANFMVKGPGMKEKNTFKFRSGDVLCFNASTQAALLHEVVNIDDGSTCPPSLGKQFEVLKGHRIGIQCRVHL